MLLPILALFASFALAALFTLLGAYFAGATGAVVGMTLGLVLSFVLIAQRAGR